jgi:predicted ester cyclase
MNQERCEAVMRCYLTEVVAQGKLELLDNIAAEDMVDHTAVAAGWGTGRSGLEMHVRYFRQCVPDLQITLDRVIASQDEVVGVWRVRGTHSGVLFGIPPTGKLIEWTNASIFRLRDGKIVDYTGVWGALEAVQQMGVEIALPKS